MLFSVATATLIATLFITIAQGSLLPLGQDCTTDAECQSEKCWPSNWHYGPTVCSPNPAGVACVDGSTCISEKCTSKGLCDKNPGTAISEAWTGPLCYTSSDCYGENCQPTFIGEGPNTQCFPTDVGNYCDDLTGCISGRCVNATCLIGNYGGALCFTLDGCEAPFVCSVSAMTSPTGYCQDYNN